MNFEIRYEFNPQTFNTVVSLIGTRQQLAINPRALTRILGGTRPAVLGTWTVNASQAADIGFIIPQEVDTHVYAATLSA